MSKKTGNSASSRQLLLVYCAVMLWLLFGWRYGATSELAQQHININLVPLHTIKQYISLLEVSAYRDHAVINLVGNVVVFIPLGYLLPRIWKWFHSIFRLLLSVTVIIILVEALQYITLLGSCDIDDLILNLLGTIIGYITWKLS